MNMQQPEPERGASRGVALTLLRTTLLATLLVSTSLAGCATQGEDPWERMNRGIFAFNEGADRWVIEPVAKGWDFVLPELAQTGIRNFFENLQMPVFVVNNLLQAEFEGGVIELYRFVLNTTFGIGGLMDVATRADWPHPNEDFGLTLGHWGVPEGPYLVLPIFGASHVRDTVGLAADSATGAYSYFVPIYVPIVARALDMLNKRSIYLEEVAQSREEAFDFYVFVRNAYLQNRRHRLTGRAEGAEGATGSPDDDLYFEDDLYDDSWDEDGDDGDNEDDGDQRDAEGA